MRRTSLSAVLLLLASCFTAQQDVPVEGCAKCSPGSSSGGHGSSSGGTGTTGTGTTGTGTTGGSTSGGSSGGPADAGVDGGSACPAGSLQFSGAVYDFCQSQQLHAKIPIAGVQIATVPAWGTASSAADGTYSICVEPTTPTTLVFSNAGYVTTYLPQFVLRPGGLTLPLEGTMYLICDGAVQSYVQQAPQYDTSKSSLYILVYSLTRGAPCAIPADGGLSLPNLSGWSVAVETADGGATGAPVAYLDDSYNPQATPTTFDTGAAIAYDVDPSLGFVTVQATKAGVQDATHDQCPLVLSQGGFTGVVAVGAGQFSFFPYIVP